MSKHILLVLTLAVVTVSMSEAVKVQLFDSMDFLGPYLTATEPQACTNLTTTNFIQEARSLKTDTCIMLFKNVNCTSYSIRVDPGEYRDLTLVKHETVNFVDPKSYRVCTASEGGSQVNVDIYGNAMQFDNPSQPYNGLLIKYRDICSCVNLPAKSPYFANVTNINNFGNCVTLYSNINCTGNSVKLLGGVSQQSQNLSSVGSFIIPSTSIGLCEHRPTCHSLNHVTFKFVLSTDEEKISDMSTSSDLAITAKTVFRNNGSATQTHTYEAFKSIRESLEISRVTEFSSTNTYSSVRSVTTEGSAGFLFLRTKVSSTLTEAYTTTQTSSQKDGVKYVSEEYRAVTIRQQIQIPPCTNYEVDSFITMVQNYPVDYSVYIYVSGMAGGERLSAEQVTERLTEGLSFVEKFDNYTIIAVGKGTLVADFSMEAVIDGAGTALDGCVVESNVTNYIM